jgi:acyl carrier protein
MKVTSETVRDFIGKLDLVPDVAQLLPDVPLIEQDMDSLDFVNLLFRFEEEYGIKIPDSDVDRARTIEEIAGVVNEKLAEKADDI